MNSLQLESATVAQLGLELMPKFTGCKRHEESATRKKVHASTELTILPLIVDRETIMQPSTAALRALRQLSRQSLPRSTTSITPKCLARRSIFTRTASVAAEAVSPAPAQSRVSSTASANGTESALEQTPLPVLNEKDPNQVDWSKSFHGLSSEAFPPEASKILLAPIDPEIIETKPDGIIYLPEIHYRRILNKAFGPGAWGLAPRGETIVTDKAVTREYALIAHGRYVQHDSSLIYDTYDFQACFNSSRRAGLFLERRYSYSFGRLQIECDGPLL